MSPIAKVPPEKEPRISNLLKNWTLEQRGIINDGKGVVIYGVGGCVVANMLKTEPNMTLICRPELESVLKGTGLIFQNAAEIAEEKRQQNKEIILLQKSL